MLDLHVCSLAFKFVEWTHLAPAPSKQWGKHFLTWNSLGIADPQHNYCFSNNHGSVENTCIWKVTPMIGGTHDCWILMIQVSLPFLPSIMVQWKLTYYTCKVTYYWKDPHFSLPCFWQERYSNCLSVVQSFGLRERWGTFSWGKGPLATLCWDAWSHGSHGFWGETPKEISKPLCVQISSPKWWDKNEDVLKLHYSHYKVDPYQL